MLNRKANSMQCIVRNKQLLQTYAFHSYQVCSRTLNFVALSTHTHIHINGFSPMFHETCPSRRGSDIVSCGCVAMFRLSVLEALPPAGVRADRHSRRANISGVAWASRHLHRREENEPGLSILPKKLLCACYGLHAVRLGFLYFHEA